VPRRQVAEGSALSHLSAARRRGLDIPHCDRVQLTIPRGFSAPRLEGVEIFRSRDFGFSDMTLKSRFRVTRVGRTLLDLSSLLERDWLRASRDVALYLVGWSVLRFTWRRVTAERDGVIAQLMCALDRAPPLTAG
jgi:hypothetical protein